MVAVVGQLEAAGQREVLGQLHRVLLLPLVDQVVRRPTVWKDTKGKDSNPILAVFNGWNRDVWRLFPSLFSSLPRFF